eukprot:scaffold1168_cov167-Amphora_coffeaeformis.AAC.32
MMTTVVANHVGSKEKAKTAKAVHVKNSAPAATTTSHLRNPTVETGRSATGSVDLSGVYDLIVNDEFKQKYDKYLSLLGQPFYVRSVAVNVISYTEEEMEQSGNGKTLGGKRMVPYIAPSFTVSKNMEVEASKV